MGSRALVLWIKLAACLGLGPYACVGSGDSAPTADIADDITAGIVAGGPSDSVNNRGPTPPMSGAESSPARGGDASTATDSRTPGMPAPQASAAPEPASQNRGPLTDPVRWQEVDPGEDPFADRPTRVACTAAMPEVLSGELVYSVDTATCNYLTARQSSLRAVAAGQRVKVRLWHFALSAPEPAEAHAAVWLNGEPLLDEHIPIPQPGGLIVREVVAEATVPEGAPVLFHLHNHGENSYSLVEVRAGP